MKFGGFFIAAALVLSACSGDPEPLAPAPTSTAAPTVTATPPALPAQASEDSPEGAAAFVTYWVAVFNYSAATGKTDLLKSISSPNCSACQSYIDTFSTIYEDGGYFRNADWQPGEISIRESDIESYATFVARTEPGTYRIDEGSDEKVSTGLDNEVTLAIRRTSESWVATQLGLGNVE